jgi:hypothetical protein
VWTDAEIGALLSESKSRLDPPTLLRSLAQAEPDSSSRRHSVDVVGRETGARFKVILRQSTLDPYNFSVILAHVAADGRQRNLRRHNGTSHSHFNPIEGSEFRNVCHVHVATERYQQRGSDIEHFAEPTNAFHDLPTAVTSMLEATNFEPPDQLSMDLPLP